MKNLLRHKRIETLTELPEVRRDLKGPAVHSSALSLPKCMGTICLRPIPIYPNLDVIPQDTLPPSPPSHAHRSHVTPGLFSTLH